MKKHFIRIIAFTIIATIIVTITVIAAVLLWRAYLTNKYAPQIYSNPAEIPATRIAIVFGASAQNGRPSHVLEDRLNAAITLYESGKVEKILLSGDNRVSHYNEPEVMYQFALDAGVPAEDLVRDYAGRRTYDTCLRAHEIFQVQEAILVTNEFHLPRSIYLCENLGIISTGFNSDNPKRPYLDRYQRWWTIRETLATTLAFKDLNIISPSVILGDPLPIN